MNETNAQKPKDKSSGGLSKKERRALKVAAEGKIKVDERKKSDDNNLGNTESVKLNYDNCIEKTSKSKLENCTDQIAGIQISNENKRKKSVSNSIKKEVDANSTEVEGKTKAQLKAERRELQEKQRQSKTVPKEQKKEIKPALIKPVKNIPKKSQLIKKKYTTGQVELFNHLHFKPLPNKECGFIDGIHPSFIRLGAQYASKTILGSNARCLALLATLKNLINDFVTPPKQELCRSFETYLQLNVDYLQKCRPFAVSMTNALRHFKVHSTQIKMDFSDFDKKHNLLKIIATYIEDEIFTAGKAISIKVSEKIFDGDTILTFGSSSLIRKILVDAHEEGKFFKVIVMDSGPLFEGREMLRKLVCASIDCEYTLINAASFIMARATKVLLGAHALLANGYVMARNGTAQVALVAQNFNKPVLVCCETYKFCERVQTDSFVYNEIGNTDLIRNGCSDKNSKITHLNLMYDVTPPNLVTAVVTELGFLPCTSVPVILRIKPTEIPSRETH